MHLNLGRREFLTSVAAGATLNGWLARVAAEAPKGPRPKACILLWMAGGPSHLDTFDLKPDAAVNVRGEFKAIDTSVPGVRISEHFPRLAKLMKHAAVLRGMSTLESDHKLATYHMHTGYQNRSGAVSFPSLGAIVARELGKRDVPLPNFVCIGKGPTEAATSGFLGPDYQPLAVTDPVKGIDHFAPSSSAKEFERQVKLLQQLEDSFQGSYKSEAGEAHSSAIERSVRLMNSEQKKAFDLSQEPAAVQEAYGKLTSAPVRPAKGGDKVVIDGLGSFGQGCLMARRLVEAGVPFVEVMNGGGVGWDTHRDNFPRTKALSEECDVAMTALIEDLKKRDLLDSTLIVWMGEFGRSPQTTTGGGRNHWSRAWSSVLIGGGIKGGQVIGRTDRDAAAVVERPISVTDFLGTVCKILGIDYEKKNHPRGIDRPIPIVDVSKGVKVLSELL
jgi:Protein of unknown function (DUF1501)